MKEWTREKKEMKEVYKERKSERRVDKHPHTERYTDRQTDTHTYTTHAHKLKSYGRDSAEPRTRYRVIQHRRLCEQGESI